MSHLKAMALLCGVVLLVVSLGGCSIFEKKTTPYEGYAFLDSTHCSIRATFVGSLDDLDMCHITHSRDVRTAHRS